MKKYIKNASKWAMLAVAAFAMFLFSFNTSAQEPGCETSYHYEFEDKWLINGVVYTECNGIPLDCFVFVLECEQQ